MHEGQLLSNSSVRTWSGRPIVYAGYSRRESRVDRDIRGVYCNRDFKPAEVERSDIDLLLLLLFLRKNPNHTINNTEGPYRNLLGPTRPLMSEFFHCSSQSSSNHGLALSNIFVWEFKNCVCSSPKKKKKVLISLLLLWGDPSLKYVFMFCVILSS